MYSLQTYVNKFVKSKTDPINILSVDVEGFDFDVLFGAGSVLDRTEYIEFEFHNKKLEKLPYYGCNKSSKWQRIYMLLVW